jgi:cell pole-organizing protein PopZ
MATASSAQREPSMEEILASIRRIIEDNDTGRKQAEDSGAIVQDLTPAPKPILAELNAYRDELRTDAPDEQPASTLGARPLEHPASIDVPSRLALIGERETAASETAFTSQPAGYQADATAEARSEATASVESAHAVEDATAAASDAEPASPLADAAATKTAIVSEQTGRQVAAAFGELSEAFASRSKKIFDDKAEEMLRPMLQDWLDNNLPTLVERLVREEIERVARGA